MKNDTRKEQAIREYFQEIVPSQIHKAIINACANLPERETDPQKAGKRGREELQGEWTEAVAAPGKKWWKSALTGMAAAAAAFVLLCGTNALNPAMAESIPIVGEAFRRYNSMNKVAVGSHVGSYGVSEVETQAQPEGDAPFTLTAKEAYSDGEYIHLSFTAENFSDEPLLQWCADAGEMMTLDLASQGVDATLKEFYYLSLPLGSTVNGEKQETAYLTLWPEAGNEVFSGTAAIKLSSPVENGQALSLVYQTEGATAVYEGGSASLYLKGGFSGALSLAADTSHNQVVKGFKNGGDVQIQEIDATPSYTKITYTIPYWGESSGSLVDHPRLYTEKGTPLRRSVLESQETDQPIDPNFVTSTWIFDGMPNGAEKVVLRFLDYDADDDMRRYLPEGGERPAGVLAEVTIDLATQETVPSETYLKAGLPFAGDHLEIFSHLNWSLVFDEVFPREDVHNYKREDIFADETMFENGFALELLDYQKDNNRLTANFYTAREYEKDLKVTVKDQTGAPIAVGSMKAENRFENDNMTFFDTQEEFEAYLDEYLQEVRDSEYSPPRDTEQMAREERAAMLKTYPGQYSWKVVMTPVPGGEPKLLDTLSVTISDPDSGEELYTRAIRFNRAQ